MQLSPAMDRRCFVRGILLLSVSVPKWAIRGLRRLFGRRLDVDTGTKSKTEDDQTR